MAPPERSGEQRPRSPAPLPAAASGTALVIPSLGAEPLRSCLRAVAALDPPPSRTVVVLTGGAGRPAPESGVELVTRSQRLGFAAAVNAGLERVLERSQRIAILNDDAVPSPAWLDQLARTLDGDPRLGAVQGTITDAAGERVDGRGIALDRYGLPVQVDHGAPLSGETRQAREVVAVSGTAALYRTAALREVAFDPSTVLDPAFGSYHEDLDLGLRLRRLGWKAAWVPGPPTRHLGSASGPRLRWRHPWWLLANRWRALAGNLAPGALLRALPVLLRGEARAARTLLRTNPRAAAVAGAVLLSLPVLTLRGWLRATPGARLRRLPAVP